MATFPEDLAPAVNSGYSFSNSGGNIVRTELSGGMPLAMIDYKPAIDLTIINLVVTRSEKIIFDNFYNNDINRGSDAFRMNLDDGSGLSQKIVKIRGGVKYSGSGDPVWRISFNVMIVCPEANIIDPDTFIFSRYPTIYYGPMYGHFNVNQGSIGNGSPVSVAVEANDNGTDVFNSIDEYGGAIAPGLSPYTSYIEAEKDWTFCTIFTDKEYTDRYFHLFSLSLGTTLRMGIYKEFASTSPVLKFSGTMMENHYGVPKFQLFQEKNVPMTVIVTKRGQELLGYIDGLLSYRYTIPNNSPYSAGSVNAFVLQSSRSDESFIGDAGVFAIFKSSLTCGEVLALSNGLHDKYNGII